jgi:hypothetical protein
MVWYAVQNYPELVSEMVAKESVLPMQMPTINPFYYAELVKWVTDGELQYLIL